MGIWSKKTKHIAKNNAERRGLGDSNGTLDMDNVKCPSCGHVFRPPRSPIVKTSTYKEFGGVPFQCPKCKYTWKP